MSDSSTLTEGLSSARRGAHPAAALLARVFACDRPAAPGARHLLYGVDTVLLGRGDKDSAERVEDSGARVLKLGVADRWMSSKHARLTKVLRAWVLEDTQSKNGVRVNGVLVQRAELQDQDLIELGRQLFVFRAETAVPPGTPLDVLSDPPRPPAPGLSTLSPELAERFAMLQKVAPSVVTVALRGPSGTGKEVLARAVHQLSGRTGPFIAVNCGALPDELVESELFGHKKGAFSGATEDRPGLIRAAHNGTLFLDEVGDLPLQAQPALLRVLQEKQVVPVGGTTPLPVDVRVISATHRDLAELVAREEFRDDLRARLSGFEFQLPTLLERREDFGVLLRALLVRVAGPKTLQVQFDPDAARALLLYDWPLNIRELEKALEAAVVLAGAGAVKPEHLPDAVRGASGKPRAQVKVELGREDAERKAKLEALLQQHHGNVSQVARELGKARMQVQRWMARYGLDPASYRR